MTLIDHSDLLTVSARVTKLLVCANNLIRAVVHIAWQKRASKKVAIV